MPKAPKKKVNPVSKKRAAQLRQYSVLRKEFLKTKYCPVCRDIYNEVRPATEIHHKAGKIGELLNYTPLWLAVSRKGHNWIHNNPARAYELGFLIHSTTVNIKQK